MNTGKNCKIEYFESFPNFMKYFGFEGKFKIHNQCIFRGEGSSEYKLLPTALRDENRKKIEKMIEYRWGGIGWYDSELAACEKERLLLVDFYDRSNREGYDIPYINSLKDDLINKKSGFFFNKNDYWISEEYIELAGIAQSYGLPTRLLDWTFDFNIALYFALMDRIYNKPYFKDDYIVLWALETTMINFFREKSPLKLIYPLYSRNNNLTSQKGVYTLWQIDKETLEENKPINLDSLETKIINYYPEFSNYKSYIYKFIIDAKDISSIYNYLELYNYTSSRLFPGFNGIVKTLQDYGKIEENFKIYSSRFK